MNFFERQDEARRSTRRLVALFVLAVVGVAAAVNAVVLTLLFLFDPLPDVSAGSIGPVPWQPDVALAVTIATLAIIGGGSLVKSAQLARGGATVAELLGGRPLDPNTVEADERRLLNVVEEMALASGTPVPTVYLLSREAGINAFAAGLTPDDTVIGVTRGAMELLTRAELQGVMGHEFSHILNGDTRLNVRLLGLLHGILVVGLLGRQIVRGGLRAGSSSRRGRGSGWPLILFGVAVYAVGHVGFFFAKLIKSAVSRQREFLADAAAVQFTRNPQGLAGALKKIGGLEAGSRLRSRHAEEASHLFFGQGAERSRFAWTSTHPPLSERIRRLDPTFDGVFPTVRPVATPTPEERPTAAAVEPATPAGLGLEAVAASVGRPTAAHFAYVAALLESLTPQLPTAAREPTSARALVCALLIDGDPEMRRRQLERLAADPSLLEEVQRLLPAIDLCPPQARLPLFDLALPALRRLSPSQYRELEAATAGLIEADRRMTLFELVLHRLLLNHLGPLLGEARPRGIVYYGLAQLGPECSLLLSALAHAGAREPEHAVKAFSAAAGRLEDLVRELELRQPDALRLSEIDRALAELATVAPRLKSRLLEACAAALRLDRAADVARRELLRAVADALDCPLPPLIDGAQPA